MEKEELQKYIDKYIDDEKKFFMMLLEEKSFNSDYFIYYLNLEQMQKLIIDVCISYPEDDSVISMSIDELFGDEKNEKE